MKLGRVALDGSKVKAHASKHKAMSYVRVKQEEKRLQKEVEQWFDRADAVAAREDELYGAGQRGDPPPSRTRGPSEAEGGAPR